MINNEFDRRAVLCFCELSANIYIFTTNVRIGCECVGDGGGVCLLGGGGGLCGVHLYHKVRDCYFCYHLLKIHND